MRVHVEQHGCAVTQGEARVMEALLEQRGHVLAAEGEADAHVLVTCTVVERTERDMERRIAALRDSGKPLLVTGCMARAQPNAIVTLAPDALVLPPQHSHQVSEWLEAGEPTPLRAAPATGLPRRLDGVVSTHVINDGCVGRCTFCITKLARPGLTSHGLDGIVADVRDAVARGAVEVRLTSQDTAAWGREQGRALPELLRALAALDRDFAVRVGMLNPMAVKPLLPGFIDAFASPRVFQFVHLPVQSGSDRVLAAMKRDHTAQDFLDIAAALRARFPDFGLWTDVIVGFPGETQDDVRATLAALDEAQPDMVNITRFSPRPGTRAATMPDQVPGWRTTAWSREVHEHARQLMLRRNLAWVGREAEALVTEHGKAGTSMARLPNYKLVVLPAQRLGARVRVRITGATETYVRGELI